MEKYYPRALEQPLKEAIAQFPAVLVTGARQCGKSTLLQHLLPHIPYLSFDDVLLRQMAEEDPELFLETHPAPLILDEIQYVPSLFSHLKERIDRKREVCGQYVLTGSQFFPLMQGVSESLAGRIMVFHLYPMSWKEIPSKDPLDPATLVQQMLRGFYPEFLRNPTLNPRFWHTAYFTTYIERDVRALRHIQNLATFQKFLTLLAARCGQLLNLSEVGKECGITQTTARDWLTLLQATAIIYLLEPFARNLTKRVVKSPKLYFTDTGLLCHLLRIQESEALLHSPFAGHLFENMVVMECVKGFAQRGENAPCYFYRTSGGIEVDLLVDRGATFEGYEIKFSASPNKEMIKSLQKAQETLNLSSATLLTMRKERLPFTETIAAQHWTSVVF